ncbi:MAG: GNAT family N-acetyltransferase [bacterium]
MNGPAGVIIRAARPEDAPAIARVHVDSWRTTYRDVMPSEFLAGLSYERRERQWTGTLGDPDAGFVFVAEDASRAVVGFAAGGRELSGDPVYTGELYAVYILEAHQGKGLGRRLMARVADRLVRAGRPAMLLWVLADNLQARRFYEKLGGEQLREQQIDIGGTRYDEVAYGWRNAGALAGMA